MEAFADTLTLQEVFLSGRPGEKLNDKHYLSVLSLHPPQNVNAMEARLGSVLLLYSPHLACT